MRSITKKNPPLNDSIRRLRKSSKNQNIQGLITNISTPAFKETSKNLVNLTNNADVSFLISNNRDAIKQKYSLLNNAYVQNFHTHFVNPTFPINILQEVIPELNSQAPAPAALSDVLTNSNGVANDLKIDGLAAPFNLSNQTVVNIGTMLTLSRILHTVGIRRLYKDSRYNSLNLVDPAHTGDGYRDSKPRLIKISGLYCAYCESPLTDGAVTDVEHKIPKGTFPTVEKLWSNFLLSCKRCNSGYKGDKYVHLENEISSDPKKGTDKVGALAYFCNDAAANLPDIIQLINATIVAIDHGGSHDIFAERARAGITEKLKRAAAQAKAEAAVTSLLSIPPNNNIPAPLNDATHISAYASIAIYNVMLNFARSKILWPDLRYNLQGIQPGSYIVSFQAFKYTLKKNTGASLTNNVTLEHINAATTLEVDRNYKMDLKGLNRSAFSGGAVESGVQLRVGVADKLDQIPAIGSVQNADLVRPLIKNLITINGLNGIHKSEKYQDQRVVRRTKAWLHAMKMLKQLEWLNAQKFEKLHDYYQEQLHPVIIKNNPNVPIKNHIADLRDDTANPIVLDQVTGPISLKIKLQTGAIDIDLKTVGARAGKTPNQIKIGDPLKPTAVVPYGAIEGRLIGEIKGAGNSRTITARLVLNTAKPQLMNKIILVKDANINETNTLTTITIGVGQGVISGNAQLGIPGSPAEILKEWDSKRTDLLSAINQANTVLKNFMWDNILNMVRTSGFYSTWARTFQKYSDGNKPYDIDLVRKLDLFAQENLEDPYQFHGTDIQEIIASF